MKRNPKSDYLQALMNVCGMLQASTSHDLTSVIRPIRPSRGTRIHGGGTCNIGARAAKAERAKRKALRKAEMRLVERPKSIKKKTVAPTRYRRAGLKYLGR